MELVESKRKEPQENYGQGNVVSSEAWSMKHEVSEEFWNMILVLSMTSKLSYELVVFGETNNKRPHSHLWVSAGKYEVLLEIIELGLG